MVLENVCRDFEPISQGASTLWPDRKSQKISEHRIRIKYQELKQVQLRQAMTQLLDKRKPRQALPPAVGGGWSRGQDGRPPGWPPWPMGPNASTLPCGASSLAPKVGSARKSCIPGVAPSYKYKGRG